MKINERSLRNRALWEARGYSLPTYDREAVKKATHEAPFWIHFGAGNLFRAFQANVAERLLNRGLIRRGLVVAEGYDYEIIEKMNRPHDGYHLLVTLKSDGTVEKKVIGSVVESLALDSDQESEIGRLREIFANPSLQMASFTITEKGYSLVNGRGEYYGDVVADFNRSPFTAQSYMGKVAALLYHRYQSGGCPIAMVSMDNCSHNGDKLSCAIRAFAEAWVKNGLCEVGFAEYVGSARSVSFPWTMIDKITPRPDSAVEAMLREDGVEETESVVTSKNTYVAPFVNAEETEYLVIEDSFPNGRPAELEEAGLLFTTRETVDMVEKMKVCTCLNPLHTALAIFGCLLGYRKISDEMKDDDLRHLVEEIGYTEGLPVVTDPGVLDPKEFIDTVLRVRLPNPFMPDTPQRIATDTSQKLAIRFGETVKAYVRSDALRVEDLRLIPLVYAGWIRYLMGVNDAGDAFALSPDPLLEAMKPYASSLELGKAPDERILEPLLRNASVFGVDLFEVGLARRVLEHLREMTEGVGAVRKTIKRVLLK